jgi:nucleoside phosphorylase
MFALKILVTFAVEAEFASWKRRYQFNPLWMDFSRLDAPFDLYKADLDGLEILVLLTGIGWSLSTDRCPLRAVLLSESPDICISSGLAGGLNATLHHGDVLVAKNVKLVSTGAVLASDANLVSVAVGSGAFTVERLLTNETIVGDAVAKQSFAAAGDAVDMESFHVLSAANGLPVRTVAIRAVSDALDEDLPFDFSRVVDRRGRVRWGNMLREVARRPQKIPALVRFGQQSQLAAGKLADFLDRYLDALTKPVLPLAKEGIVAA